MQKKILADKRKVEVNIYGNSKVSVILLSGWTHDFKYETKFIKELKKKYRVITISYPGYSKSEENIRSQSMNYLANLVNIIVKELNIKSKKIVGFSMGCQVALNYFKEYDQTSKLILISPQLIPLDKSVPIYGKIILKSNFLLSWVRNINFLKLFFVNQAYKSIYKITEGVNKTIYFKGSKVSLNGAFDTLVATLTSFINPLKYKDRVKFIFGEKEILQNGFNLKYQIIKDSGHGNFKTKFREIAKII